MSYIATVKVISMTTGKSGKVVYVNLEHNSAIIAARLAFEAVEGYSVNDDVAQRHCVVLGIVPNEAAADRIRAKLAVKFKRSFIEMSGELAEFASISEGWLNLWFSGVNGNDDWRAIPREHAAELIAQTVAAIEKYKDKHGLPTETEETI